MKRLEYIDAMRGLAILLVVIGHIMLFGFHHTNGNYLYAILNDQLELPLFFLISGLFSYKPIETWNGKKIGTTIRDKFFTLIVPSLFFCMLYIWINDLGLTETLFHSHKHGYWFTFALFEFLVLYICLILITKLLRLKSIGEDIFMVSAAIIVLYASVFFLKNANAYPVIDLFCLRQMSFFIYFVLGTVIGKRFDWFCRCMDNKIVSGILIPTYLVLALYTFEDLQQYRYFGSSTLYFMLLNTILLMIVFLLFRKHADFCKENRIGKFLQYIGKHTLEIYLIHYFFLPRNLQPIGNFFTQHFNPVLEYLTATGFAILVILITLLASHIIRLSPLSAQWLLGTKPEKKMIRQ